jgi:putative OPT family oligopeptide transporter
MAATDPPDVVRLPENAYRTLAPGEPYVPIVPASAAPPESTWRAIAWGVVLCVVFTIASAYSGLKVGQVMEASIPISILAIGLARVYRRRSTLLENVILTGAGGTSGAVVAGAIFTLPALYILNLDPHPLQTVLICLAGGCLGILFLIPLRRYFVRDMHGQLPYPEATAITEVLVTGERGGSQAALLLQATAIAGVYDFLVTTFQVWKEYVNFRFIPVVQALADRAKIAFSFDAVAFILGLGYVMGLRSSMLLCAGGVLSNFVLVPLIWMIGRTMPDVIVSPGAIPIAEMSAEQIFRGYVRFVGVGAIATAGIFGIVKSLRVVIGSFSIAARTFRQGHVAASERTDHDIPMISVLLGVVVSTLVVAAFFTSLEASLPYMLLGTALTVGFSFFFASVAANAIATTARNPVSGMTMLTIIISSIVLLRFGLSGQAGMFFVMAIAGMVCTALSVSGQFITDLKTGYWLGSTPSAQQRVKFLGVVASAVAAGLTIVLLAKAFQFGEALPGDTRTVLAAPQASIMKALVEGFMSQQPVAYLLFAAGVMVAVMMEMLGVPPLIVALGMYLPLELNLPALVGGALSHYVGTRADAAGGDAGRSMRERGVIVASGFMAGGALGGVIGAALRLFSWYSEDLVKTPFYDIDWISQVVSIAGFLLFCWYLWRKALGRLRARGSAATAAVTLVALGLTSSGAAAQAPARAPARPAASTVPAVYVPGPHPDWQRREPAALGLDPTRIRDAVDFALSNETKAPRDLAVAHYLAQFREPYDAPVGPLKERGPATGLIVYRGYIVAAWGEPERGDMTFSVTKSFLSTTVGLAVDRGIIRSVHDTVADYVQTEHFASAHNATITWDHLLRQTSDWEGTLWGKPDWADRPDPDPKKWMNRPRQAPGTVYEYNDVRVNVLALAALNVWRRPLPQVLREHVMDPIGASPTWRWHGYENSWVPLDGQMMQSVSGGGHWGGGMFISALDQARFGLLTLRRGRWGDRQVLSDAWVAMALTPTTAEPTYGFMNWFLNTGRKELPSAPASSFFHLGAGTNAIYCDPEHDLVIVARWIERKALDGLVQRTIAAIGPPPSAAPGPMATAGTPPTPAAQRPAGPLAHTYSIVARDPVTGDLGVAVQSHWFAVGSNVTWAEPGVGAIATQSFIEPAYGARGLARLRDGLSAPDALEALLEADAQRDGRQVAIVDAKGRVAAHTGAACIQAAGHVLGPQFSAQANLMASDRVWPAMAEAFGTATGDLADRLLAALDAAEAVGGDIRGRQSAALVVVRAASTGRNWVGADRVFDLRVDDHPEPLVELRRLVRLQRAYNHANRGDELFSSQNVDAALEEYAAAARLAPEIAELPFWQAVTLASVGREVEAMPLFRQVFAREPRWAELVPRLPASKLLPDDAALVARILAQRPKPAPTAGIAAGAITGSIAIVKSGPVKRSWSTSFASMDTNDDGGLSKAEFTTGMTALFKGADANGDGNLTREEATAAFPNEGAGYFDLLDTQKTGTVSAAAFSESALKVFTAADTNADGSISAAERDAAKKTTGGN